LASEVEVDRKKGGDIRGRGGEGKYVDGLFSWQLFGDRPVLLNENDFPPGVEGVWA